MGHPWGAGCPWECGTPTMHEMPVVLGGCPRCIGRPWGAWAAGRACSARGAWGTHHGWVPLIDGMPVARGAPTPQPLHLPTGAPGWLQLPAVPHGSVHDCSTGQQQDSILCGGSAGCPPALPLTACAPAAFVARGPTLSHHACRLGGQLEGLCAPPPIAAPLSRDGHTQHPLCSFRGIKRPVPAAALPRSLACPPQPPGQEAVVLLSST